MARPSKDRTPREVEAPAKIPFTGVARSVECYEHEGWPNFKIVTLTIENGEVVGKTLSDAYANWETIARLEIVAQDATLSLKAGYAHGKAWSK